jgi:hypothetical protein
VKEDQEEHLKVPEGPSNGATPFWRTLPRRLRKIVPLENPSDEPVELGDKIIGILADSDSRRLYTLKLELAAESVKYQIRNRPGDKEKSLKLAARAQLVEELFKLRVHEYFGLVAEKVGFKICQNWTIVDVLNSDGNGMGGLKNMLAKVLAMKLGRGMPGGLPLPLAMLMGMGDGEELPFGLRRGSPFDLPGMGEEEEPGSRRFPGECG